MIDDSARVCCDLDALVAERHGRLVRAEEAVGEHGGEGDGDGGPRLAAEAAVHAARLAPGHLLVAVVRQVQQLCRRRASRQDQVRRRLKLELLTRWSREIEEREKEAEDRQTVKPIERTWSRRKTAQELASEARLGTAV
jgi:hypothetical protein